MLSSRRVFPRDRRNPRVESARLKELGRRAMPILIRYRDDPDPEVRASIRELMGL